MSCTSASAQSSLQRSQWEEDGEVGGDHQAVSLVWSDRAWCQRGERARGRSIA